MKHSLKLVLISSTILFVSPESLPRHAGPVKRERLRIGVHLYNDVRVPNEQVDAAEEVASRVFRQSGVELNWSDCTVSRSPSGSLSSPCDSPAQSGALVVYFVGPLEAHFHWVDRNALACSIIPDTNEPATMAYISYSRIQRFSDSTLLGVADLLGLAAAHEIGHLLFGSHEHANQGIMQPSWPWHDLHAQAWGKFQFSRDEASRLRTAVRARLEAAKLGIDKSQSKPETAMRTFTGPTTDVLFAFLAPPLCAAPAVCQQDTVQLAFQEQTLPGARSAISDLLERAEKGDRIAQFNAGLVPSSVWLITELKTRAESGDSAAQQYLINFLSQADTLSPGYDTALAWARSAASRNDPGARFVLGYLYEHGHGVLRDYAQAVQNYETAALQGHSLAQNNLAGLYSHGLGVRKDETKAFRLFLAAALQGNRIAQWNLGHAYYDGAGTPRDYAQAARWFRAAAELGDPFAQHDLGVLYFKGQGVPVDYAEAVRWERLSAMQGDVAAETSLGYFYETGKGVPLNYVEAYVWYSRASAAGDSLASKRRKSLSRLMTPKQFIEANSFSSQE